MNLEFEEKLTNILPAHHESAILRIFQLTPDIFRIRLKNEPLATSSQAGQFINIKIAENHTPLWRRPFSIHDVNKNEKWIDILFRVVGQGTHLLSGMRAGDSLNLIGPLGKGFRVMNHEESVAICIAGGLGIAPLLFLARILRENNIVLNLFWGAKTKSEFCIIDEFETLGVQIHLSTEDGTMGYRGLVTDLAEQKINTLVRPEKTMMFSCGPNPMLRRVGEIAENFSIPCQISLETIMACGLGACLGCGVKTNQAEIGYHYVCKDGPVFFSNEIDLSD